MFHQIKRPIILCLVLISFTLPANALVEIARPGAEEPVIIEDVYLREGTAFISIDDVLAATCPTLINFDFLNLII